MTDFRFQKEERLKSRKMIDQLFSKGQSFGQYPLRIVWVKTEAGQHQYPVQFALSVPKRKFAKAAHRNRLRRQIREAYRLHKHRLYAGLKNEEQQFAIMILYTAKEPLPYEQIEKSMKGIIHRFIKKIRKPRQ